MPADVPALPPRTAARRLMELFRPYWGQLALALVLALVGASLPALLVYVIQHVLDDVLIRHDAVALGLLAPGVVVLYAVNGATTVARASLNRGVAWRVVTDLRNRLHAHLLRLDVAWHQRTPLGERVSRLTGDVNNLQYALFGIVGAIQKPFTLLGLVTTAFFLNPKLAAVALAVLPLIALPIDRFSAWLRRSSRDSLDAAARLSGDAQETLAGIRVVQVFGGEPTRQAAFEAVNEAHYAAQVRALTAQILPGPIVELLAAVGVGAAIAVGGRQVFAGEIAPGELIGFLVALGLMNEPLKGLAQIHALVQRALAAAESVFGLLDEPPAVTSTATRHAVPPQEITFDHVGFDYGDGDVLGGVELTVAAGQRVAIVGRSGAGKSTLLALACRLRDPTNGGVRWDGVDLRDLDLASVRAQVAVVTQEPFLFDDTVAGNLRFGRPDATDEEVRAAAEAANAHDFIATLPKGYATRIDELGMRLSGGQRQRLCIARALLRGAPVLLLDEATSNLDAESEALVQDALERLMVGRTTLVVAHRLSTIRDADLIVVFADGRIVERGRHADLLAAGGEYARLVARQTGERV